MFLVSYWHANTVIPTHVAYFTPVLMWIKEHINFTLVCTLVNQRTQQQQLGPSYTHKQKQLKGKNNIINSEFINVNF